MAKHKNKSKSNKNKIKKKKPSLFIRLFKWVLVLALWAGIFLTCIILWFAKDLPDITQSATFERRASIIIKASDGSILSRYGESKGANIAVEELPDHLIHAVIATEDRRFYDHIGVDILGITRAMIINTRKWRFVQGGSTITQQLAKNLFLTHKRELSRKIQESLLAIWIERELSKNDILSAYMNRVYLGSGTYGFEAAAQLYFGKSAKHVNLREAAILAGLLKAPSKYSPHNNIKLAKQRSDVVLTSMKAAGYINKSEMEAAKTMHISLPHKKSKSAQNIRYFTDWVIDGIDDLVGRPNMDMVIETTLDIKMQNHAHKTLASTIKSADKDKYISQGAILSMRPNGAILTMVGGYDYGKSQFNRTTQAKRSPGSAFKPFLYLSAIEKGWHADDTILDAPITKGSYRPKNFAGKYYGSVTLNHALEKSMNTASIRLAKEIGIGNVMKTAKKLGVFSKMEADLSLALGSSGISMIEMGTAYSVLANGGKRVYPYAITRISNNDGRVLYQRKTPKTYQTIIKAKHANEITNMMENVINQGTGRGAKLPFPAAGKTGTSQNNRDAWFVGYTDKIVSIIWLGNDDNSPMRRVTGGAEPARIWRDVMLYSNARHDAVTLNTPKEESNNISGLLGRLLSNDNKLTPNNTRKPKYND